MDIQPLYLDLRVIIIYLRLKFEWATHATVGFHAKHWRYQISPSSMLYCAHCVSKLLFVHYFTAGRSVAISVSVCMRVSKTTCLTSRIFQYKFPVTTSLFSSDDRTICHVFLVLGMTSCVHTGQGIGLYRDYDNNKFPTHSRLRTTDGWKTRKTQGSNASVPIYRIDTPTAPSYGHYTGQPALAGTSS